MKRGYTIALIITLLSIVHSKAWAQLTLESSVCVDFERLGRLEEAQACALNMLQDETDSAYINVAHTVLARVQVEYSNYALATEYYQKGKQLLPSNHRRSFDFLFEVSQFYLDYVNTDSALYHFEYALHEARNLVDSLHVYNKLATAYHFKSDTLAEQNMLLKIERHLPSLDSNEQAHYALGKAEYLFDTKRYVEAFTPFITAKDYFAERDRFREAGSAVYSAASCYERIQSYLRAADLYKESLEYRIKHNSPEVANTMNAIAWCYANAQQNDSALKYAQASLEMFDQKAPNSTFKAYPLGNIGLIYNAINRCDLAEPYARQAADLFNKIGFIPGVEESLITLGDCAFKRGAIDTSKSYYAQARDLINNVEYSEIDDLNCLLGEVKVLTLEGKHKQANTKLSRAIALKDKFLDQDIANQLYRLEMENSLNKSRKEIATISEDKEEKERELRRTRFSLVTIVIVVFILLASIVIITISWKQRQRALKDQSETLSINQEIIRMISHDFRGPMNNIKSLMEILKLEEHSKEQFDELTDIIYQQTSDTSLMFESFVNWALSQSNNYIPQRDRTHWSENVQEVLSLLSPLAQFKNIGLIFENEEDFVISTDRVASQLILRNIISNAIKFSNQGSSILISVYKQGDFLATEIKDQGIGMSEDRIKEIFKPDLVSQQGTSLEQGTGLGLKMALKFTELNEGKIEVNSKEGVGTKFTILLPL